MGNLLRKVRPEKIIEGVDFLHVMLDKVAPFVTIVVFLFIILGTYDNARAQESGVYVMEVHENAQEGVGVMYPDSESSYGNLKATTTAEGLIQAAGHICGINDGENNGCIVVEDAGQAEKLPALTRQGILNTVDNEVTAMVYDPPGISLTTHVANQWIPDADTGTTSVYAQSDGYDFLKNYLGLEDIWEMFRNLAYAGFVLTLMVSGFMIMFRSKIGGQTTVSIVNTIPGVLVGLVLVTFSFAIVGFIMDIGRLITIIAANYMETALGSPGGFEVKGLSGPFQMAWYAFESSGPLNETIFAEMTEWILAGGLMSSLFKGAIVSTVGLVFLLILAAICLYAAIRVYITLVMTYIKLFLDLMLGPIYILFGSLPGKSTITVDWIKRVFGSVLVFPLVFFIINLGRYIGYSSIDTGMTGPIEFMSGGTPTTPVLQFRGIFVLASYFLAAGAPSLVNDILAVAESKGVAKAVGDAQKAASKIPLVGGVFGG